LRCEAVARNAARVRDTARTRKRRGSSIHRNDAELPVFAPFIRFCQPRGDVGGSGAAGEKFERPRAVGGVREGLRCDRARAGAHPRHDGTDAQELGLNCDADFAARTVGGNDGKCARVHPCRTSPPVAARPFTETRGRHGTVNVTLRRVRNNR